MELTKYEIARIIGARASQLAQGAPPLVEVKPGEMDFLKIAEKELEMGVLPLAVLRERRGN